MNGSPGPREGHERVPCDETADETATRLAAVRERIEAACARAGRSATGVSLLAVSKTFPAEAVLGLARLGQRAFGENYVQEALGKISACQAQQPGLALDWHFIGPIQSNKTRQIAESFDWVHSIDREKIAARLGEQRPAGLPPLQCCIQVNVSGEASKSGCRPDETPGIARAIAGQPRLQLRGLMVIPEPTDDERLQRQRFATARLLLDDLRTTFEREHPERAGALDTLSMGMSADLEAAIAEGATIVRIGSALFGERPRKARGDLGSLP